MILALLLFVCSTRSQMQEDVRWEQFLGPFEVNQLGSASSNSSSPSFPGSRRSHGCVPGLEPTELMCFGGLGFDQLSFVPAFLSDWWKLDLQSRTWSFERGPANPVTVPRDAFGDYRVRGAFSPLNQIGAREPAFVGSLNASTALIFGGLAHAADGFGYCSDIWLYHMPSKQYQWVSGGPNITQMRGGSYSGPAPAPGGREGSASFVHQRSLFVYGGRGYGTVQGQVGFLSDMWRYNMDSGIWSWLSGSTVVNAPNLVFSPGSRSEFPASWYTQGVFYMFGGYGVGPSVGSEGYLGDLWRFDPAAFLWTLLSGPRELNSYGNASALGVFHPLNRPGARSRALTWVADDGRLWLYGGRGYGQAGNSSGLLNDLWVYDTSLAQWAYMKGSLEPDSPLILGLCDFQTPQSLEGAATWSNSSFLFMHGGRDAQGDLTGIWRFSQDECPRNVTTLPATNATTAAATTTVATTTLTPTVTPTTTVAPSTLRPTLMPTLALTLAPSDAPSSAPPTPHPPTAAPPPTPSITLMCSLREGLDYFPPGPLPSRDGWTGSGTVSNARAQSLPHSLAAHSSAVSTNTVGAFVSGAWRFAVAIFVPSGAVAPSTVRLLTVGSAPLLDVSLTPSNEQISSAMGQARPLIRERWVALEVYVELDLGFFSVYYNGSALIVGSVIPPPQRSISAFQVRATAQLGAYYDDFSFCNALLDRGPPSEEDIYEGMLAFNSVPPNELKALPPNITRPFSIIPYVMGAGGAAVLASMVVTPLVLIPVFRATRKQDSA